MKPLPVHHGSSQRLPDTEFSDVHEQLRPLAGSTGLITAEPSFTRSSPIRSCVQGPWDRLRVIFGYYALQGTPPSLSKVPRQQVCDFLIRGRRAMLERFSVFQFLQMLKDAGLIPAVLPASHARVVYSSHTEVS